MALDDFTPPLVTLRDGVVSYFTAHGVTASVVLGWRERTKQVNQGPGGANRVVLQPSDDNGNGGTIESPHGPGTRIRKDSNGNAIGHDRALRTWHQVVMVSVWGVDPTNPQDEAATYAATWKLLVWTVRAIHTSAGANVEPSSTVTWTTSPTELTYGREARFGLILRQPIPDVPKELAFPGVGAITKKLNEP